jgi:hypothetical protein
VRSNLTLNIGLRYDYLQPFRDSRGRMANIEQDGLLLTQLVTLETARFPRAMVRPDRNNFGPRFGLAWQPGPLRGAVLRAGYGIYYNHIHPNAPFGMTEASQARGSYDVIGNLSGAPNVFLRDPFASAVAPGVTLNATPSYDPFYRDAYIQQWNFGLQKRLPFGFLLDTAYVGSKGTALSVSFKNMNQPLALVDPRTPGLASLNSRRPNPAFPRPVAGDKPIGSSIYHSWQARADRRLARGWTSLTAYTWSKCISGPADIGGDIGGGSYIGEPQNLYSLANERSLCGFDVTQRFVQTVIYELPWWAASRGWKRRLLRGWQLSTITTVQSGFPADIPYGVDTTGTGVSSRTDSVPGQKANLPPAGRTWQRWFNTAAFAPAPFGRFGSSPRTGAIRLPGLVNIDFSASRLLPLGEARRVELRAEFFNLPNFYNIEPGSVDRNFRSATFGAIGGGVQGVTSRVIQLGAKVYF